MNIQKSIKEFNEWEGTYKKVLIQDEKISGAVLFGNTKEGNKLLSMINKRADISEYLETEKGGELRSQFCGYLCLMKKLFVDVMV